MIYCFQNKLRPYFKAYCEQISFLNYRFIVWIYLRPRVILNRFDSCTNVFKVIQCGSDQISCLKWRLFCTDHCERISCLKCKARSWCMDHCKMIYCLKNTFCHTVRLVVKWFQIKVILHGKLWNGFLSKTYIKVILYCSLWNDFYSDIQLNTHSSWKFLFYELLRY